MNDMNLNWVFNTFYYLHAWKNRAHIVLYLEELGDWGFLKDIHQHLIEIKAVEVVVIKSFNEQLPVNNVFNIGNGISRVILFRSTRSKVFITTMTDLGNLGLPKSFYGTSFVYVFHSLASIRAVYLEGAFDNYDYIFACHQTHVEELVERRKSKGLNYKIGQGGYPRLDRIILEYQETSMKTEQAVEKKRVLIAPTWGVSALTPEQIARIVHSLGEKYEIVLRFHPMVTKRKKGKEYLNKVARLVGDLAEFDGDVSNVSQFTESDLLITDWSGSAFEFSMGTGKPVISIDNPRKIRNPYFKASEVTLESSLRFAMGDVVSPENLNLVDEIVQRLLKPQSKEKNRQSVLEKCQVFNLGNSSKVIAKEITQLIEGKTKSSFWT